MLTSIYTLLQEKKPNLSEKSVSNYTSNLLRLAQRTFGSEFDENTFYDELYTRKGSKAVLKYLEDNVKNLSTRKTSLAALVSCCPEKTDEQKRACKLYQLNMLNDMDEYSDEQKNQEKSETQKRNWKSWDEIRELYKQREAEITYLWKRETYTHAEYKKLLMFVLASCYVLIPPRRIQDYQFLRWNKTDSENHVQGKKLVFNKYKTAKTYKEQIVVMPNSLHNILKKWRLKNADKEYVFSDSKGQPFDQPVISKMLNQFFGHGVSVNILRHSFITNELKDMPLLTDMEKNAEAMGNSTSQQILYRKK